VDCHSNRPEQVEDRNSKLEDKIEIKEKTEEIMVKQFKSYEKKIQEFRDSTKRPNLRVMVIEEGEEMQAKRIRNIFNKIITENFPNLKKVFPIKVQEASRTPNRFDQNRTSPWNIIIKTNRTVNKERILKALQEKKTNYI
jgi:hypothetical protein